MNKKQIPLSGDALSTGVTLDKATASQLNMEAGRVIKHAAIRIGEAVNGGKKPEEDAEYNKALERVGELNSLAKTKLLAAAQHPAVSDEHRQEIANL